MNDVHLCCFTKMGSYSQNGWIARDDQCVFLYVNFFSYSSIYQANKNETTMVTLNLNNLHRSINDLLRII